MVFFYWIRYRFFSRCWASGCGRLMIGHSSWERWRCENTVLGVVVVESDEDSMAA
jgi:hypothetical protein